MQYARASSSHSCPELRVFIGNDSIRISKEESSRPFGRTYDFSWGLIPWQMGPNEWSLSKAEYI
jgi:hypothetical protein